MNTTSVTQLVHTMEHYGALATPLDFTFVNTELAKLSESAGFPLDQLRFILCLFAAYPLAWLQRRLPSATIKHVFNIVIGIGTAQFVYSAGWLHSFLSAMVTYGLVKFAPVRYMPYIVFVANMAFVAALHIYRMTVDYMGWSMDSTGSQMLLLIRLTSFAFNYYDGAVEASMAIKDSDSPSQIKIKQSRRALAVSQLPTLLEFLGYTYCFTTFLAGPSFEYREYIDSINGSKFIYKGQIRRISSLGAAASKFVIGVFFMAVLAVFGSYADVRRVLQADSSLMAKCAGIMLALFLTRGKYYCAWKLAEGSTILSGTGFEGFDSQGNPKGWNGVSNVDILGFELSQSIRDLSRSWNKGTQLWLERYVYNRTGNSLIATYFCSAVWHGFYPGYYLFFLTVPLATSVNRLARRHVRPYFLLEDGSAAPLKPIYDIVGMLCTAFVINYLAVSFVVLSWTDAIHGFQSMHFAGHIGLLVAYLLLSSVPIKRTSKKVL
ncbi:hypothetical protein P43SY_002614 [Pythium insidiosum]|uniref:Lysophospholipid acyltransferase n=1 Tax=Pythium insidiosum TaxID=114742 RepID=A0AAD5LUX5_PYTIN|nr:hypothetical protein P43SY_002614 [Pythium insidiosum]